MDMKRDHYEDIRLFSSGVVLVRILISMGFLIAFPFNAVWLGAPCTRSRIAPSRIKKSAISKSDHAASWRGANGS